MLQCSPKRGTTMLTEDFLGRIAIVLVLTVLATFGVISIFGHFNQDTSASSLAVITQAAATVLLLLQVVMTVSRLPAKGTARGIEPRITALAGSFLMLVAMFLTPALESEAAQIAALCSIFVGTVTSIFCLYWLGRSFSIMATARQLVASGPYSLVRHPLYVCEAVFVLGMILSHFSVLMVIFGAFQFLLQYRRARNEEAILRQTFPEYDEYARRVPMFIPRIFRAAVPAVDKP